MKANSAHPRSLIRSIPIGEYLHPKRNCSTEKGFREEAIKSKNKQPGEVHVATRLTTTYTNEHGQIKEILQKYWPILAQDDLLKMISLQDQI